MLNQISFLSHADCSSAGLSIFRDPHTSPEKKKKKILWYKIGRKTDRQTQTVRSNGKTVILSAGHILLKIQLEVYAEMQNDQGRLNTAVDL